MLERLGRVLSKRFIHASLELAAIDEPGEGVVSFLERELRRQIVADLDGLLESLTALLQCPGDAGDDEQQDRDDQGKEKSTQTERAHQLPFDIEGAQEQQTADSQRGGGAGVENLAQAYRQTVRHQSGPRGCRRIGMPCL